MEDEGCIFCKIVRGEVPSAKVHENELTLAFLDINPNNKGHTLVIPKSHIVNIYDMPEDILCDIARTVKTLALAVKNGVDADGINIIMNNDGAAGQIVFHAHIHIIPRYEDDGFRHWPGTSYDDGEMAAVAERVRGALPS